MASAKEETQSVKAPVAEPKGRRDFRSNSEVEKLYRFIHESDLRREAKMIFELIVSNIRPAKRGRKAKVKKEI